LLKPISFKDLLFNEVSVVTPINFIFPETFLQAFKAFRPEPI
tara:strand:+ start:530 stop:655 length:126 start_codon:yes stop_codon:yes gene_type:complete